MGVEGEAILRDIERYYAKEMLSMEDVHKNLASKHRRSEALIKAIVKDKTVRVEEEMAALLKYSRAKLLTLRTGSNSVDIFDASNSVNPQEVLSNVRGEFRSRKRQYEDEKKRALEARQAREAREAEEMENRR